MCGFYISWGKKGVKTKGKKSENKYIYNTAFFLRLQCHRLLIQVFKINGNINFIEFSVSVLMAEY